MEVALYGRRDCPLCDKAKDVLRAFGQTFREIDIDAEDDLRRRYTDDVPVILIDGAETFRHRVSEEQLRLVSSGWRVMDGHHLEKEFRFPDFAQPLAFVNRAGAAAEELEHHPDILLGWGKARVMTWSHDANAITARDWKLAAAIEALTR